MSMYHQMNVLRTVEVAPSNYAAGATNGTGVDMQGWDAVEFIAILGAIGNGGTYDLRVVESANANFSGAINVTNAALIQVPNTQANVVAAIHVYRPTNRYVRVVSTATTNAVNVTVLAERHRGTGRQGAALPTNHQYVVVQAN